MEHDEQRSLIRDQAERLVRDANAMVTTRGLLDTLGQFDQALWQQAVDSGWPAMALSEAEGGLGLGLAEQCLVAEALGRQAASVPFLASAVLASTALQRHASPQQAERWLPALAAGEVLGCVGFADGHESGPTRVPTLRWQDGRLQGELAPVLGGAFAGLLIALARQNDEATDPGVLVLCDLKAPSVHVEALDSLDNGRGYARIRFDGAAAERLGHSHAGLSELHSLLAHAALPAAFEAVAGADACLAMARDYALQRKAFGQPIGGFQAIKHTLADAYAAIQIARANANAALRALDEGRPDASTWTTLAATARLSAIKAYDFVARQNIQVHGGFGVTWEADGHLHYRRARCLALDLGAAPYWRDRLIEQLSAAPAAQPAVQGA